MFLNRSLRPVALARGEVSGWPAFMAQSSSTPAGSNARPSPAREPSSGYSCLKCLLRQEARKASFTGGCGVRMNKRTARCRVALSHCTNNSSRIRTRSGANGFGWEHGYLKNALVVAFENLCWSIFRRRRRQRLKPPDEMRPISVEVENG